MGEWQEVAFAHRSVCHWETWIAQIAGGDFMSTPAGPLRVVKKAVEREVANEHGVEVRWRKDATPSRSEDAWICEIRWAS